VSEQETGKKRQDKGGKESEDSKGKGLINHVAYLFLLILLATCIVVDVQRKERGA
jgi:hypothetical protein